ncbi:MAG: adenylyltransferase/cytidyltransferase family protein [Candidatus Obscuribacter sp.]|nr:adenylyltransferase/cytidyltransferase family protein [Candidatus Obscuribacter sp.]
MHYKAQDAAISRRLTRQFGKQFARILADSPTLRSDLRKLDALNVRIQRWNGRQEATVVPIRRDAKNSFIAIGSLASPVMKAIYLAHEAYHVLYGTTPGEPNPSRISRKKYVSMGVAEETRAFMHQTKVAHELWSSCNHVLPAWQMHFASKKQMETLHVGVLGGTFDPVHNGHIFVAEYVRTHLGLDRVYFVTAKLPPHKSHHMADAEVRHAMVEAAVKDKPHLVPCRLELDRAGTSYTVDTFRRLQGVIGTRCASQSDYQCRVPQS